MYHVLEDSNQIYAQTKYQDWLAWSNCFKNWKFSKMILMIECFCISDAFTICCFRFLQTSEMLKPSTPSTSHDSSQGQEENADYFPNVGRQILQYLYNKTMVA